MDSPLFTQLTMPATDFARVKTLVWHGDTLIDWANGYGRWTLDGHHERAPWTSFGPFNAVCTSPDGRTVVISNRCGTKALVFQDGRLLRELNRSYYHAQDYEYPVTLFNAPDGRRLLAHCPDKYLRLEIEDALTGERLTAPCERKPQDFFHSRLTANPSGTRLMSAGWRWHPQDLIKVFDVAGALTDPRLLDEDSAMMEGMALFADQGSAVWMTDDRILIGGNDEDIDPEELAERRAQGPRLEPNGLAIYDLVERRCLHAVSIGQTVGTLMLVGDRHVISFYEQPKLFEIASGRLVHTWADLASGKQTSSILYGAALPPLALDPARARFALADAEKITVVSVNLSAL